MGQHLRKSGCIVGALLVSLVAQAQTEAPAKPLRYDTLAMILALLALIGLVLLWRQSRQVATKSTSNRGAEGRSSSEFWELSNRVTALDEKNRQLTSQLRALEADIKQLKEKPPVRNEYRQPGNAPSAAGPPPADPRPAAQPTSSAPVNRPGESAAPSPRPMATQSQRTAPVNSPPTKLYARTVDVPGGFSVGSLVETPNRPMVFVITPTGPGEATFRVTDDAEAQRLALSDPYSYLSDACNYQSRPEINSRIHTVSDGRVQLQGEKWHIIEKAEISFYA